MARITTELAHRIARDAISEPYRQIDLLDTGELQDWLVKRGMRFINWETLHFLWTVGVLRPVALQPIAVEATPGLVDSERFYEIELQGHARLLVDVGVDVDVIPSLTGYWETKLPYELKQSLLWSPLQLPKFRRMWEALRHGMARDMSLHDSDECGKFTARLIREVPGQLLQLANDQLSEVNDRLLALLLAVEPVVHPLVHGQISFAPSQSANSYFTWREHYDSKGQAAALGLSVEELEGHHRELSVTAHMLDPYDHLRVLLRHVHSKKRSRMKGKALAANDLYDIAETLRRYVEHDLSHPLPEEDDILWPEDAQRAKLDLFGSKRTVDADRKTLWRILRHFNLDPQVRATWFLEGDTEEAFFRRLAELEGIDLDRSGLVLFNLGGKEKYEHPVMRHLFDQHQASGSFVFMSLDRDRQGGSKHVDDLKRFERQGWLTASYKLWEPDFEQENFPVSELALAANRLASARGSNLTIEEREILAMMSDRQQPAGKVLETLLKQRHVYISKGPDWGRTLAELAHERGLAKPALGVFANFFRHSYFDYDASVETMVERRAGR